MMPEELVKKLLEIKPAKITAEVDKNGISTVAVEGRGMELIALSQTIIYEIIKDSNGVFTVDEYCEILKCGINEISKPKEQREVENEIMKKIFESVFK